MLLDLTYTHDEASNAAIEYLCKSVEDSLLFAAHPTDALLGAVEDLSYVWLNAALTALYDRALWVFTGQGGILKKATMPDDGPEQRCRKLEAQVKDAIPGTLPMSTYLAIVDCLMSQYMPIAVLESEAQRQSVRQYMAGQYRQRKPGQYGDVKEAALRLPESIPQAVQTGLVHPIDEARLRVAQASAVRHVQDLSQAARSKMRRVVIDAERERINNRTAAFSPQRVQQALLDNFAELNRDWRRIAVSETGMNAADAFLGASANGETVRWMAHPGACAYCQSMSGRIFTVVAPEAPDKDPETQVWAGKHVLNIGRAISKRKRTEAGLVERGADEHVVPAILAHPSCRCQWVHHIAAMRQRGAA